MAGKGADTVVAGSNANIDVGNGGATRVYAIGNSTLTMGNYDPTSKAGIQTANSDISVAIFTGRIGLNNGEIITSQGVVKVNSSASADIVADAGDTEGSTVVNIYSNAGKMTKVGFTHNEGGALLI